MMSPGEMFPALPIVIDKGDTREDHWRMQAAEMKVSGQSPIYLSKK